MAKAVSKRANLTQGQAVAAVRRYRRPKVVGLDAARAKARRKAIETSIKRQIDNQTADGSMIAGYALVVWGYDGKSTAKSFTDGGVSPSMLVPDFVKNRLLADKIEDWTIETVNESLAGG